MKNLIRPNFKRGMVTCIHDLQDHWIMTLKCMYDYNMWVQSALTKANGRPKIHGWSSGWSIRRIGIPAIVGLVPH